MSDRAEPKWPEGVRPTAEQWRDWFLACGPESQAEIATHILHNSDSAFRCVLRNHKALEDEVDRLSHRLSRYRTAWHSARRYRRAARYVLSGQADRP